jgi:peptidoglycan/xylan/chitin deacetylase (PgdA/CDA1 family)
MRRALRDAAALLDRKLAPVGIRFERPALLSFLFHAVFVSDDEIELGHVHPQEGMTSERFERFFDHLLHAGYTFVDVGEIENGLGESGFYAFITFDDGYANNLRLLEVLRSYRIPATFFISTSHVAEGKRYWWDAVYSERRRRGGSLHAVEIEIQQLKQYPPEAIERYLAREFGPRATLPQGDLDRPLAPNELRDLAHTPMVTIGNHTSDHAILTLLSPSEMGEQLSGAQHYLEDLIGTRVSAVSYPNGNHNDSVLRVASDVGLTLGITTVRRKDSLPIPDRRLLELGRFQLERGVDLDEQVRAVRSEVQLANTARRLRARMSPI